MYIILPIGRQMCGSFCNLQVHYMMSQIFPVLFYHWCKCITDGSVLLFAAEQYVQGVLCLYSFMCVYIVCKVYVWVQVFAGVHVRVCVYRCVCAGVCAVCRYKSKKWAT